MTNNEPINQLIDRLRTRATIRRQISGRKSVQEGKPDRLADLLDEAANELETLQVFASNASGYCTVLREECLASHARVAEFLIRRSLKAE